VGGEGGGAQAQARAGAPFIFLFPCLFVPAGLARARPVLRFWFLTHHASLCFRASVRPALNPFALRTFWGLPGGGRGVCGGVRSANQLNLTR
jgi:hypothetical protein